MRIKWYGTASLLLESGQTRLLIDPYLKNLNPSLYRVPLDEAKTCRAIFVTHPHIDHFGDVDVFSEGTSTPVFVSSNGIARAAAAGRDTSAMIDYEPNTEIMIGDFVIHTYKSRHCSFDTATVLRVFFAPRTWRRCRDCVSLLHSTRKYRLDGDVYALHISDGEKSVMILGSAGMDPDVGYPQNADLLVFPYQGRSRMHKYMERFLETFRPKAVMADHFDDAFPPLTHTEDLKHFAPTVKKILPSAAAIVQREGEWYEI